MPLQSLLLAGAGLLVMDAFNHRRWHYPAADSLILPMHDQPQAQQPQPGRWVITLGDGMRPPLAIFTGDRPDQVDHSQPLRFHHSPGRLHLTDHLPPAAQRSFELVMADGQRLTLAQRFLNMEGVPNFRDIGGYMTRDGQRLRWGRVYRSGLMAHPTTADQMRLSALALRRVCDLRSEDEAAEAPDRLPDNLHQYHHYPVQAEVPGRIAQVAMLLNQDRMRRVMPHLYTRVMLDENGPLIGAVFAHLADADQLPLVIHCTGGKDRTGVIVALLLEALGVDEGTIIADYSQSNRDYQAYRQRGQQAIRPLRPLGITIDHLQPVLICDPDTLRFTFAHLRSHYGSARDYLRAHAGVSEAMLDQIAGHLLEPVAGLS